MTAGIILIWSITFYLTTIILHRQFKVPLSTLTFTLLVTFLVVMTPIYFLWPAFNTVANHILGIKQHYFDAFWGYGLYFMLSSFVSLAYYKQAVKVQSGRNL